MELFITTNTLSALIHLTFSRLLQEMQSHLAGAWDHFPCFLQHRAPFLLVPSWAYTLWVSLSFPPMNCSPACCYTMLSLHMISYLSPVILSLLTTLLYTFFDWYDALQPLSLSASFFSFLKHAPKHYLSAFSWSLQKFSPVGFCFLTFPVAEFVLYPFFSPWTHYLIWTHRFY